MSIHLEEVFAQCGAFYRDTSIPWPTILSYEVGMLFREPTFCDATYKFGGLAAPHRYLIISANARCVDSFSAYPEWGLCMWKSGRIFKVIARHRTDAFTQITLLEVPDDLREELTTAQLSEIEHEFAERAGEQFLIAATLPPLPEHTDVSWLSRLEFPLGINDSGEFFEKWQYCGT